MFSKQIKRNKEKGITLIVLVITIIGLLILAGVSIATLTGNSGLTEKISEADIKNGLGEIKEALEIYKMNQKMKKVENGKYTETISNQDLITEGILIEKEMQDTGRILGILKDPKTIGINSKWGKGYQEKDIQTVSELNDVYAIDLDDEILYYIRNTDVWSIENINHLAEIPERVKLITRWKVGRDINGEIEKIELPLFKHSYNSFDCTVEVMHIDENQNEVLEQTKQIKDNIDGVYLTADEFSQSRTIIPENTGEYVLKIRGICNSFSFIDVASSKDMITKLENWGETNLGGNRNYGMISFKNCTNLSGTIPEPSKKTFINIIYFTDLFFGCTNLTGSIPENLFANTNPNSFIRTFYMCKQLSGNIPRNLFKSCTNTTIFNTTFYECNNLTGEIPDGLFDNCTEVTVFFSCFSGCSGLTGNLPKGLLKNKTKVTNFSRMFTGCSGITGTIPEDFFENCINANDMSLVFAECTGITDISKNLLTNVNNGNNNQISSLSGFLQNTGITSVPEGLFNQCTEVKFFGENNWAYAGVFQGCKNLKTVPYNLFSNCRKVECYTNAFRDCSNLTGKMPELWNNTDNTKENYFPNVLYYSHCFTGTPNDIKAQVPVAWGGTASL